MRGQIYWCTNDNRKKISGEVKLKGKKKIHSVLTVEIQLTSSMKSQTLHKEKSFQYSDHRRASEPFLTGFETRGQPNLDPVFAQRLLSGFSLPLTSPTFLLALNSTWRRKQETVTTSLDYLPLKANNPLDDAPAE